MAPFYGRGSTLPRLQSQYKERVYFVPLGSQEYLVLIWSTSDRWKADSNFEPPSEFECETSGLKIQRPDY